ncbi:MAG TPA: hypothetical protein VIE43_12540 [Thermoanaerobaculia bacterium]|jgi:hypothetical protein|nr:hypothetical protein [Thermoanaerobaculia bacterium]
MNKPMDVATFLINRAGDLLFVNNPRGTSIGVFSGLAVHGAMQFFHPWLLRWKAAIDPDRITAIPLMAIFIVLFNIRSLSKRRRLPDEIEDAILSIRLAKREGKLTAVQEKMAWLALTTKVVEKVNLKAPAPRVRSSR